MRKPAEKRDICATERGWNRHRKQGELSCQECRDAHNLHRRTNVYSTEKNRKHKQEYLAKPEKAAMRDEYAKNYVKPLTEAELIARETSRRQTQLKRLHRKLVALQEAKSKQEAKAARMIETMAKQTAHKAQMAINAENRRIAVEAYRAEKKARDEAAKEARRLERERIRAEKAALKPAPLTPEEKEAKKQGRLKANLEAKMARVVEHGTTYAMYSLCKFQNGTACKPCKAAAAEYALSRRVADRERDRAVRKAYNEANPERLRDRRRLAKNRRERGAKANGQVFYTRVSILERDDYTCHICLERVDTSAPHDNFSPGWEMYPHLDHVIPLSKGGPDTPDNVKTAHARCNIDKRDSYDTPVNTL